MNSSRGSPRSRPRKKAYHHKVFSGCLTCRNRRVKCNENKPTCGNCLKGERLCHGKRYAYPTAKHKPQEPNALDHRGFWTGTLYRPVNSIAVLESTAPPLLHPLAGSRNDPFDSFSVRQPQRAAIEILDHAVTHQWAMFASSANQQGLQFVKQDVMSHAIHDDAAWHAVVYAGAAHRAFARSTPGDLCQIDATRLRLKQQAIRAIINKLERNGDRAIDEGLPIAVTIMASHGSGEQVMKEKLGTVQRRKKLVPALDAEFYSALEAGPVHLATLFSLVEKRGGISSIQSHSLQVAITMFDVWFSFKYMLQPHLPRVQPLQSLFKMRTWHWDIEAKSMAARFATGFPRLFQELDTNNKNVTMLHQLIAAYRLLSVDFNQFIRLTTQKSTTQDPAYIPEQQSLLWIRSLTTWELLNLPFQPTNTLNQAPSSPRPSTILYSLIRLSIYMYCQSWLWVVVSPKINRARTLVLHARPLLEQASNTVNNNSPPLSSLHQNFFLYILVLSLTLAYEDFDQTGDETTLRQVSRLLPRTNTELVLESWRGIAGTMETFLWSKADNDAAAREAWGYTCGMLARDEHREKGKGKVSERRTCQ